MFKQSVYVESKDNFDPEKVKKYLDKNNAVRAKPIKIKMKEHFLVGLENLGNLNSL
jgi:hypothetical protein